MRKIALIGGVFALWIATAWAEDPQPLSKEGTRGFMRAKLTHSQTILEDLALANFEGIAKNAEQLRLLSLDSNWQVEQSAEYSWHSAEFRRAASGLIEAADNRNMDGAVLGYFRLTQSCVNCHKHLRGLEQPGAKKPAAGSPSSTRP